ncbi:MAG: DUF1385 domain-containing protein [Ruminococcus sp.]|nr:DUF1385 domain-containing protein [Ruminococcus sp.]
MSKNEQGRKPQHRSKIGGQALIEGIMMKGADTGAMACRLPDGTIDVETWEENNGKNMPWYRKCPFVRGSFNFVLSMKDGYRCLMKSAEKQMTDEDEEEEEMSRFEQWLNDKLGDKLFGIIMSIAMVIGVAMALVIFMFLPKFLISLLIDYTPLPDTNMLRSALEGVLKIVIFLCYMMLTGCMKDIRRTYEYHGAEHKTIACFEAGDALTVENVKKHSRFHPRCGTSFIFITLIVSILVMCLVPIRIVWLRTLVSIALLPLTVGVSYEFIRLAGRSNSTLTRALSWPGLQIQRITTREPDEGQIECAIAALKPCIPEDMSDDQW